MSEVSKKYRKEDRKEVDRLKVNRLIRRLIDTPGKTFDYKSAIQLKDMINIIATRECGGTSDLNLTTNKRDFSGLGIMDRARVFSMPEFTVEPKRLGLVFSGSAFYIHDNRCADRVGNSYRLTFNLLTGNAVKVKRLEAMDVASSKMRSIVSQTLPHQLCDPSLDYTSWKKTSYDALGEAKANLMFFNSFALPIDIYEASSNLLSKVNPNPKNFRFIP